MPTTIIEGFATLWRNLEITNLQHATVSTRQQNVRAAIEKELGVLDTFLTVSYRRSTMIASLAKADIDIVVVLDPNISYKKVKPTYSNGSAASCSRHTRRRHELAGTDKQ